MRLMITEIEIENFKSVERVKLPLGRFNVVVGENGCGKSNLLEAIAYAGAVSDGKGDHEFLMSRGIRPAPPKLLLPAFGEPRPKGSRVSVTGEAADSAVLRLASDGEPTSSQMAVAKRVLAKMPSSDLSEEEVAALLNGMVTRHASQKFGLDRFLIYSPEETTLRRSYDVGQILPIGIHGEGLLAHLRDWARDPDSAPQLDALGERLRLLDWFRHLKVPEDLLVNERRLAIADRFLSDETVIDERSVNEGFLFLLFYFTLFISPKTPSFFAVDNIDASLNPKLCARLTRDLVELAKAHDKQVIVTTHNPAILDGLDLEDDAQRLFVASRTSKGATRVRRVSAPTPTRNKPPVALSEAFMRGYLGGLPDHF